MDIKHYYQEKGEGFPLILIHGNGEDSDYFRYQIEYFSKDYRVIAYDVRGRGRTPRGTTDFTIEQFAEDLTSLMDDIDIKKAHILGFSDGANIAMKFVLKHPERVEKLILNGGNLVPQGVRGIYQRPIEIGFAFLWVLSRFGILVSRYEQFRLMVREPFISEREISGVRCETLVIAGTRDMIKDSHTRKIAECIPNAKLAIIPGDHFIARKKPEEFNRKIEDFLKKAGF